MRLRLRRRLSFDALGHVCVCGKIAPKRSVRGGRGVVQIASSVPPAIFDFQRIYSFRASYLQCDTRFEPV